jgi:hypothetical protein
MAWQGTWSGTGCAAAGRDANSMPGAVRVRSGSSRGGFGQLETLHPDAYRDIAATSRPSGSRSRSCRSCPRGYANVPVTGRRSRAPLEGRGSARRRPRTRRRCPATPRRPAAPLEATSSCLPLQGRAVGDPLGYALSRTGRKARGSQAGCSGERSPVHPTDDVAAPAVLGCWGHEPGDGLEGDHRRC